MKDTRSIFVISKDDDEKNVGCGVISKIDDDTTELKRLGKGILEYLEKKQISLDIKK